MANTIIGIFAAFLFLITLASAIESSQWWIRVWDFPRLLITFSAIITLALSIWLASGNIRWAVIIGLIGVIGWQSYRIYPYTPLASKEVVFTNLDEGTNTNQCFKALSYNVLQDNRNYQPTIDMLESEDADIVLLLETDQKWIDAISPVMEKYPYKVEVAQDNLYGLAFYSRLPVSRHEVRYIAEKGTPSIFVWLETPDGEKFHYIGLHPRPPQPGLDTQNRDGEIATAAKMAAEENIPVMAMGDFNDVAWSKTSQTFKRIGGYLDPRLGRGFYATFPAYWPIFRWPLDHLFITPEFAISGVEVLKNKGSDHLPVTAVLCLETGLGEALNGTPAPAKTEDYEDANEMIDDMKDEGPKKNPEPEK